MIQRAAGLIVVAAGGKTSRVCPARICGVTDVAALVTDTGAEQAGTEAIRRTGTEVIIAWEENSGGPVDPAVSRSSYPVRENGRPRMPLLIAGVVAGPLYVVVTLIEIASRDGFDPRRHAWSQLANGDGGWIHSANLIVTGLLVILAAYRWRKRAFLAVFGLSMVLAGFFPADPGRGFPAGAPEVVPLSTAGAVHFAAGGIGFVCLIVACFQHRARVVGALFALGYLVLIAGAGAAWSLLAFTAAVIMAFAWISTVSLRMIKTEEDR